MIFRCFFYLIPILLIGTAPIVAQTRADPVAVQAMKNLHSLDQRLHEIGYRLATENAPFCNEQTYRSGLLLHDIEQYGDKHTAATVHKFEAPISVNAVAGFNSRSVFAGDGLVSINGKLLSDLDLNDPEIKKEQVQYRRLAAINKMIASELAHRIPFRNSASTATFLRNGEQVFRQISPRVSCRSRFEIRPDNKRKAYANGTVVTISSALAEYVDSDDELAAIAAHELAHNLLKHRDRLNRQKVNRGFFGQFGKSAGRIKQTEIEADRLSVWLMHNAGYDPQAAINFWTRYGKEHGRGIFSASTHYRWKKRVKLFEEELAKMAIAEAIDGKFAPPLLANKP